MEKKLITEMKFMMERLENPRMTYTQYEKKRNKLNEGAITIQDIAKKYGGESEGDLDPKYQTVVNGKLITLKNDKIEIYDLNDKSDFPRMPELNKVSNRGNEEIIQFLDSSLGLSQNNNRE